MNGRYMALSWIVLCGSSALPATRAQVYSLQDLGELKNPAGGRSESVPKAINAAGEIVAVNLVNGAYHAFRYSGSWKDLGTLGGNESLACSINARGQVVGFSQTAAGAKRAFVWTQNGTDGVQANPEMRDLGTLSDGESEAYDINSIGQISGYSFTSNGAHAFLYSSGKMTDLGAVSKKLPNSFGYAINTAGQVAGDAYDDAYSTPRAFFYDGAAMAEIGTLGGESSSVSTLNDRGLIVGYSATANGVDHAFLYSSGKMTDLGTLGGQYSYAVGINNSNIIVGGSFVDADDRIYRAFVSSGNSLRDLNQLVDTTATGWTLIEARAINDSGQIVGVGTYKGASRIFLLQPASRPAEFRIAAIRISGRDVLVDFASKVGTAYSIQSRDAIGKGSWTSLVTGIQGTGGVQTTKLTDSATRPGQFYRILQ